MLGSRAAGLAGPGGRQIYGTGPGGGGDFGRGNPDDNKQSHVSLISACPRFHLWNTPGALYLYMNSV